MSLWICPQHGLTGPAACCNQAVFANVQPASFGSSPTFSVSDLETRLEQAERERDEARALLGLAELPEEPPEYAPDGYGIELERIADALVGHEADVEPTASQAVRGVLDESARRLIESVNLRAKLAALADVAEDFECDMARIENCQHPELRERLLKAIADARKP